MKKKHLPSKITTKPNKIRDSEHLISGNITLEPVGEKTRSIASLQITLKFKTKTSSLILKILYILIQNPPATLPKPNEENRFSPFL
jgi:hypothetical protein